MTPSSMDDVIQKKMPYSISCSNSCCVSICEAIIAPQGGDRATAKAPRLDGASSAGWQDFDDRC